jgi:hypothetical protein
MQSGVAEVGRLALVNRSSRQAAANRSADDQDADVPISPRFWAALPWPRLCIKCWHVSTEIW